MVDTAQLVARVTTKGVTKATSDLDKFADEAKRADSGTAKLGKSAKAMAPLMLKAGIAIGTASLAMLVIAKRAVDAQREWQTLANIAGDSVIKFKAAAFATDQVGISAEKLADISKDTREKLGEFIASGGGGFKDFFEEVAPLIGVTSDELEGLSGIKVLGRVKNAMDQANISMERQSFFLESIASDTTNLIPLLADEGAELERLASKFNVLNDRLETTAAQDKSLKELSESLKLISIAGEGASVQLASIFSSSAAGLVEDWAAAITTASTSISEFFDSFSAAENQQVLANVNKRINAQIVTLENLNDVIATSTRGVFENQSQFKKRVDGYKSETDAIRAQIDVLRDRRHELFKSDSPVADAAAGAVGQGDGFNPLADASAEIAQWNAMQDERLARQQDLMSLRRNLASEFRISEEDAELEHLNKITKMEDDAARLTLANQKENDAMREQAVSATFSNLSMLMFSGNQELFRIGQAAALANAFVNVAAGVTEALKLGPILGPALAVSIAAAGGVQIAAISSQKPPSARQQGGQFGAGQDLLVGEKGPELVRFGSGGRIANANETAGMNGSAPIRVKIVNQTTGKIDSAEASLTRGEVVVIVREVVNQDIMQPNSRFNKGIDATRQAPRIR